ncbi:MAG TPA: ABC transporter permease, partial [Pyrinomonadaceae bacterium]|nr:ABC transporter permease [Pyrinomonadaceae bacterium]
MNKLFAIINYEYRKIVLRWSFLIGTFLVPLLGAFFAVVPALIFSIRGEMTRILVYDESGKVAQWLKDESGDEVEAGLQQTVNNAQNVSDGVGQAADAPKVKVNEPPGARPDIKFIQFTEAQDRESARSKMIGKINDEEADAYLIIPKNYFSDGEVEFRSRRAADFPTIESVRNAVNRAIRFQRFNDAQVNLSLVEQLMKPIKYDIKGLDETGAERDSAGVFIAAFAIAFMIYILLSIYGQAILASVVEEKETRIAEILFSSARPFILMLGKLIGVGLAGITQLAVWVISVSVILFVASFQSGLRPFLESVPSITPLMIVYFLIFFFLGYFIYASIFALIGSVVTTVQEGGQFSFPPIMIMLIGFYFCFLVIRDPDSTISFWVSIAPFFAPLTMPVRIFASSPPFWHVLLAMLVCLATIAGVVWLAARIYRTGMLMYGKRATIPEIWRWM